jgi:hypothetical protein
MIARSIRKAVFSAVGCALLAGSTALAGCGSTQPPSADAGAGHPAALATAASSAATAAVTSTPAAGGGGLTACALITPQDATTAIGSTVGPGTPGGTAALSECIYGDGALIVGMRTDSKAFYEQSQTAATAKGATNVSGVGDGAFEAGAGQVTTLLFLKGTTIVSIILSAPGAKEAAVTVAKVAAAKL